MYRCLCTAGPDGDTAIHLACLYGQKGCAEALIAAGCKLDPINSEDGTTPLHDASAGGYAGIAQLLFDKAGLGMVPLLVSKCSVVSGFQ
jgi:ankyrin repeat protein